MAIPIEGYCVVAQQDRILHLLDGDTFQIPNSTAIGDTHIWRCSFMAETDARKFLQTLEDEGMNVSQGPDSDAVLVNEFDRSIDPCCEWLQTGVWDKAVIAWTEGTQPDSVTAQKGWDPKIGSGLVFHDPSKMEHLKFLRLEDNVEVFLNKETGKEVFIGRTSTPIDALFAEASKLIQQHFVSAGEPALTGESATAVSDAVQKLEKVIAEAPDLWNAQWYYGKGQLALGNHEVAYQAFSRAYDLDKTTEIIPRELAGVCLELKKFDEAVTASEAAVALDPSNAESLGNLALSYLMAGRIEHAQKAIDAAIKMAPDDKINHSISRILSEVIENRRPQPESLRDLSTPAKRKKKKFLGVSW